MFRVTKLWDAEAGMFIVALLPSVEIWADTKEKHVTIYCAWLFWVVTIHLQKRYEDEN